MNFPSPPTDNLYKFLAIAGVTLILACIYLPPILIANVENQKELIVEDWTREQRQLKKAQMYIDSITLQEKTLFKRFDTLQAWIKKKKVGVIPSNFELFLSNMDIYHSASSDVKNQIDQIIQLKDRHIKKQEDAMLYSQDTAQAIVDLENVNQILIFSMWFGPLCGICLSVFGFYFWRTRTQIPQDIITKAQAEESHIFECCQSCSSVFADMQFYHMLEYSEKKKLVYCGICFHNGVFLEPDLNLAQMTERVEQYCRKNNVEYLRRIQQKEKLKNLLRWKKKFILPPSSVSLPPSST
ncbi:zinc ribbon domain-containing protein [Aurantibacillus circumpalustris]|uniref:zinc ribbon domain-containing protein n=1 Tax=Aurantibacillus circumpalustris TaxID=3036359 RepID=UPI00295BFD88|nr:zinc ribbon domain-containing protein [Aurantibacillus circumpalustris]